MALLLGFGGWVLLAGDEGCDRLRLSVAAAPDIAPAIDQAADRFNDSRPKVDRFCVEVAVSARESAQTAAVIAGDRSASAEQAPDGWIPDSSIWADLARSQARRPGTVLAGGQSVASSPTVIGMPQPVAARVGEAGPVGWRRLVQQLGSDRPLNVGFPDPTRNTTGLAAMLAVGQIGDNSSETRVRRVALMRQLAQGAADTPEDLFRKLPRAAEPESLGASVAALPVTEQAVWRYNSGRPAVPLLAVYPAEGALRLDYPYLLTTPTSDQLRVRAGERFQAELQKAGARKDLLAAGFRAPDGTAGGAQWAELGLDPRIPDATPKPPAQAVAAALNSWKALSLATRILVLIDVSGTMNQKVPASGKSRIQVTTAAAAQGLGLFSDTTEMGLWSFSSQIGGKNQDWRELVSTGPMTEPVGDVTRRAALANALTRITAAPQDTGLYDSILAAYRSQRAGYKPGKVNSVLVFTDGKNNDPAGGVSLDTLLAQIKRLNDPKRPIPIFIIAFGRPADVDMPTMRRIAQTANGAAYNANTSAEISQVFLDAVGQRTCRPNC